MAALLAASALALLVACVPGACAQGTNAVCSFGYDWMNNTMHQSPCLIASWLFTPCSSSADSWVYPLDDGYHYNTPLLSATSATPCRCNTVFWATYSQNCTAPGSDVVIGQFPEPIPAGTSIPAWAYIDVTVSGTFNATLAQARANEDLPDSSAPVSASSTQTTQSTPPTSSDSGATNPTSGFTTTSSPSDNTSAPSGTDTPNSKSNVGAIVGGVVGGIAGLLVIGAFFSMPCVAGTKDIEARRVGTAPGSEPSPRLYDPNDPTTFPSQGHVPSLSAPSFNPTMMTQHSYRGAPEL
ncbi:uncharacterized protein BXZ73DRAFT_97173 [Epithele typhae]|uniref:uncharacterized protein n=1 Tax=Epithele typhae TaxID=378194 RepID=UPI00200743E7|nr:uncharacterized protein BXZ73DRAFT_97173 [Epithele typhae]KAH9943118.1 hypothetical protein BXZ73DRAFT_97173 [Epithele typhae]